LELNRENETTQMVLQSENEMGNWNYKSAIANEVANLKLNKKQFGCSAIWCYRSKKIMEKIKRLLTLNQIETKNENKTTITKISSAW
jgi:hypothetical protein